MGCKYQSDWESSVEEYAQKYPEEGAEFKQLISGELPDGWDNALPVRAILMTSKFHYRYVMRKLMGAVLCRPSRPRMQVTLLVTCRRDA